MFEDINLADEDDEAKLVARLRAWKSRYAAITVIFDRGIPGGRDRNLSGGGVREGGLRRGPGPGGRPNPPAAAQAARG